MKLTTEQKTILIDTCNAMINRDATSDYSANLREVAKVALSVLTINQEPKAWYIRTDDSVTTDPAEAKMWVGIPLYAAPAVPAEATPEDIPQEHNINTYSGITWAAAWNACRAAMLAAAPESGNDHDTRR